MDRLGLDRTAANMGTALKTALSHLNAVHDSSFEITNARLACTLGYTRGKRAANPDMSSEAELRLAAEELSDAMGEISELLKRDELDFLSRGNAFMGRAYISSANLLAEVALLEFEPIPETAPV